MSLLLTPGRVVPRTTYRGVSPNLPSDKDLPAAAGLPSHNTSKYIFSIFGHETSPLEKPIFLHTKPPKYFPDPRGPRALVSRSMQAIVVVSVDLTTYRSPIQLPSRIQGAMHPASTLSLKGMMMVEGKKMLEKALIWPLWGEGQNDLKRREEKE